MIKKRKYSYYLSMQKMCECAFKAASELMCILKNYENCNMSAHLQKMHRIENECDQYRRDIMLQLGHESKCPLDREDIAGLSNALDDIVDMVEDVSIGLYIYNVQTINDTSLAYGKVILMCCASVQKILLEFENSKTSNVLYEEIQRVNLLEERGDELFADSTREIFKHEKDPIEVLKWKSIYDRMEAACDACENVAHLIESVMIKHT